MNRISREQIEELKAQAIMAEKGGAEFSVRLAVTGGYLSATQLEAVARLATQFGDGSVHLTTRQGLEIPHVPWANIAPLRAALHDAGLALAAAGRRVRGITACPGTYCLRGLVDSQGLAQRLHARVGARNGLPHKFKIAVAGCANGCTKPRENDLGILGRKGAFTVFVGGRMGKQTRLADPLPFEIGDEAALLDLVEAVIDWYAAQGTPGERFGATIDRLGLSLLVQSLATDAEVP